MANGGITEMTKIETEWQNAEQERQEDFIQHEPPEVEFVFYNQVQQGDVASVEKNLKSGQYRHIAMKTRLSTDLVQNFRYHCIISLAMVTRFCIEGGMPGEQAYRMSDFYIHKVDEATTIDLVEELHDAACMDYAKRMQQIKNKPVCSKPVTLCLNYIYAHMHEKITTEDLAEEVHLHPSYLSRLFREQMGCTLHDYILDQKIQTAKQMLQFSERSYAEIANLLAFSSQSHFIQVFSKKVGVTPRQFRESEYRSTLMRGDAPKM